MDSVHCASHLQLYNTLRFTPPPLSTSSISLLSVKSCRQFAIHPPEILRRSHRPGTRLSSLPESSDGDSGAPGPAFGGLDSLPFFDSNIVAACAIGLLTGVGVVLFNNTVHEIRDFFWDGIPSGGASFLRDEPIGERWQRVISVPICGGIIVSLLNKIRDLLNQEQKSGGAVFSAKKAAIPFMKAVAASVTLGTGNSLGPEGPSVEIGVSIAKGTGSIFSKNNGKNLSLLAAGSAAGISSGFNAAVSGCFFAVESVLWPSAEDSSSSSPVTNTTSVVILSAVIASVISEIGLGTDPAFTVPEYDFRSPGELPLYLLLGILCGAISLALSKCTAFAITAADYFHKATGIPKSIFPAFGGLTTGILALSYPEILYWGFENVDLLLESRPSAIILPPGLLLQLVVVKIVATSLSRASGLVGGYYAPSLFIGAATGMAYGKFIAMYPPLQLHIFEVASPQAYGLVGMAATLAGVCQVPLTSVLLLFELTQDYRIVLPLLGAVGLSSLVSSASNRKKISLQSSEQPAKEDSTSDDGSMAELCEMESSLCMYESDEIIYEDLTVAEAMRDIYVAVFKDTPLLEAIELMREGKQSCAVIVDKDDLYEGLLMLDDVSRAARDLTDLAGDCSVSDFCRRESWCLCAAVAGGASLVSAERMLELQGASQLPVVSGEDEEGRGRVVGLLDRECIDIARRARTVKDLLRVPEQSEENGKNAPEIIQSSKSR